jgi:thiosulfate dehydrogenase [quinone] large subunit
LSEGPEVGEGQDIAEASEVEPGSAIPFTDAGSGEQAVLLRLEGGEFAAYSAICTHMGCEVAYDRAEGTLECPCHGSIFDPENGAEVVEGPASRPLPEIPVRVEGGRVVRV